MTLFLLAGGTALLVVLLVAFATRNVKRASDDWTDEGNVR